MKNARSFTEKELLELRVQAQEITIECKNGIIESNNSQIKTMQKHIDFLERVKGESGGNCLFYSLPRSPKGDHLKVVHCNFID